MAAVKKLRKYFLFAVFTVLISAVLSCELGSGDSFYVRCTLNGEEFEWTSGTDGFIFDPESGMAVPSDEPYGFIMINQETSAKSLMIIGSRDPANWGGNGIVITVPGDSPYSGKAGQPTRIKINDNFLWWCDYNTDVTVDSIGSIGGLITGTFSGTDDEGDLVTDGRFMVRRVEDYILEGGL